eukprot:TRINITY_DN20051_c0_g1_i1.p1 TRINITY_DN20051_c0_g1~~TRINITY_DN20051_c0_g1_i1.p1  ORF type:complete len:762 (+),score=126.12 TRINITY_DN20051_c0_g1_i1:75-2360(+)
MSVCRDVKNQSLPTFLVDATVECGAYIGRLTPDWCVCCKCCGAIIEIRQWQEGHVPYSAHGTANRVFVTQTIYGHLETPLELSEALKPESQFYLISNTILPPPSSQLETYPLSFGAVLPTGIDDDEYIQPSAVVEENAPSELKTDHLKATEENKMNLQDMIETQRLRKVNQLRAYVENINQKAHLIQKDGVTLDHRRRSFERRVSVLNEEISSSERLCKSLESRLRSKREEVQLLQNEYERKVTFLLEQKSYLESFLIGLHGTAKASGFANIGPTVVLCDSKCELYMGNKCDDVPERFSSVLNAVKVIQSKYPKDILECQTIPQDPYLINIKSYLGFAHVQSYIEEVYSKCMEAELKNDSLPFGDDVENEGGDTIITPGTWNAATCAVASVCDAVDRVLSGSARNVFCIVRPPGHHAGRNGRTANASSQGFCLFNNSAVGAKYARIVRHVSRVAVFDFDVHHGNGTEEILMDDPGCMYISSHAFGKGFYPSSGGASIPEFGIINIPYPTTFDGSVVPMVIKRTIAALSGFRPDLIILSSGFDSHEDDPMVSGFQSGWNSTHFYEITRQVVQYADMYCAGRLVSVLEGGYDAGVNGALQDAALQHLLALMRKPMMGGYVSRSTITRAQKLENPVLSAPAHLPPDQCDYIRDSRLWQDTERELKMPPKYEYQDRSESRTSAPTSTNQAEGRRSLGRREGRTSDSLKPMEKGSNPVQKRSLDGSQIPPDSLSEESLQSTKKASLVTNRTLSVGRQIEIIDIDDC